MKCCFKQITKISVKVVLLAVFLIPVLLSSCLNPHYIDSESNIVKRSTDTALNDSALIYGTVFDGPDTTSSPFSGADIWIEGSDIKTTSSIQGNFNLRLSPGTYSVKCLHPRRDERFTMTIDISLSPNEKVGIQFFHGNVSE